MPGTARERPGIPESRNKDHRARSSLLNPASGRRAADDVGRHGGPRSAHSITFSFPAANAAELLGRRSPIRFAILRNAELRIPERVAAGKFLPGRVSVVTRRWPGFHLSSGSARKNAASGPWGLPTTDHWHAPCSLSAPSRRRLGIHCLKTIRNAGELAASAEPAGSFHEGSNGSEIAKSLRMV